MYISAAVSIVGRSSNGVSGGVGCLSFEHLPKLRTFAETFGVWLNSSLALQAGFVRVELRDTSNCDVVDHPQLVSFLNDNS